MLTVDASDQTPPFEQIRDQLRAQIVAGDLDVGARLPSVRRLAADLGVAPGTVARAYRELEQAGLVRTNRRTGTIVAPLAPAGGRSAAELAAYCVTGMRGLGLTDEQIVAAVQDCLLHDPRPSADLGT
ncbi:transcriptional regulator, GntR family [Actinomyces ruminicola]|uniref:Transcriptional regulator, GntR family n=1 Tax=Actinomyces ruminicola TaxID=332524 RepID=A0A1G9ZGI7_9ACTO|nr:GntR family transcriptional regulator [Actinomyces ruminicola]SDN20364.1 transcriptional regulator, GntR family [Actinomyces ruminicola]